MKKDSAFFVCIWKVEVETLNVKPSMPSKVENSAICLINLSVAMGPNASFVEFQQRMHTRSKKMCAKSTLQEILNDKDGLLHCFLKLDWCHEGSVGLEFHNVQLKLLAKCEAWLFDEVDDSTMEILYDFVYDGHCLKCVIHY